MDGRSGRGKRNGREERRRVGETERQGGRGEPQGMDVRIAEEQPGKREVDRQEGRGRKRRRGWDGGCKAGRGSAILVFLSCRLQCVGNYDDGTHTLTDENYTLRRM